MAVATDLDAGTRAAEVAARHFRWNFGALLVDACAFFAGLAFFDSTTVLPVLLSRLHASDAQIGLTRLIQTLGFTLPALLAAHWIHGRANHKSYLIATCAIGRTGLFLLPVAILLWGSSRPVVALIVILAIYGVFWFMDGACAVSWVDIVAKTIPERVRGRFFGTMQAAMGGLAMLCGYGVTRILRSDGLPFPANFALLAGLWCVGAWISELALVFIREPPGTVDETDDKPPFAAYVRRAVPLLRQNPRIRYLIGIRLLLDGAGLAGPFYVLFAQRDLHVSLRMVGIYVMVQCVGKLSTGPLWGWISDRYGPVTGLRVVSCCIAGMPLLALGAANGHAWLLPLVFLLLGGVQDGLWMVASNALLESVEAIERPLAIGVATMFQTPSALYGLIGGLLAEASSYPVVFTAALAFACTGAVVALRMPSTRGCAA